MVRSKGLAITLEKEREGVILSLLCAVPVSSHQRHCFSVGFAFFPLGVTLKHFFD